MAEETQLVKCGAAALQTAIEKPKAMERFVGMLGNKQAQQFKNALITIVANNDALAKCDVASILGCASQIATMGLSITPSLGLAGVMPFWSSKKNGYEAQVQIFRDGYVELMLRSGQIAAVANEVVYEGELVSSNRFKDEYVFDSSKRVSDKVIGYMAYARTLFGFEKTVYMTREEVYNHAMKYSDTFKKNKGLWKSDFNAMALKTVLRKLIKKYLPKSTEMQTAMIADQGVFRNMDDETPYYVDNTNEQKPVEPEQIEVVEVEDAPIQELKPL